VLVTGGTGGLGALVARHLVERHGVRDLLLTSRRGPAAAGADGLAAALGELGARVRVEACDVADRAALTALLGTVPDLVGVLHTAGVVDDGAVTGLTREQLDAALRPKVDAGALLDELTADRDLAAFVLFSSVTGVVGTLGQAGYAAANVFLDALAERRAAAGRPAVSVGWGLWSTSTGITAGLTGADKARLAGAGLAPLSTAQGLALLDAALGTTGAVLATEWDLAAVRTRAEAGGEVPAVLRGLVRPRRAVEAPGAVPAAGLADRLAGLDRAAAESVLRDVVRAQLAAALGHASPAAVDLETPFTEQGLDSLTAVELRTALGAEVGLRLPATVVFNRPTVLALADFLLQELLPPPPAPDELLRRALDQVETALAGAGPDARTQVLALLQSATGRLSATAAGPDNLDEISDEDMFDFIDQL
jgi:polyketide synthase 7